MVGYITIAHGTAQRLSEKWRHVACTSAVITFCTSLHFVLAWADASFKSTMQARGTGRVALSNGRGQIAGSPTTKEVERLELSYHLRFGVIASSTVGCYHSIVAPWPSSEVELGRERANGLVHVHSFPPRAVLFCSFVPKPILSENAKDNNRTLQIETLGRSTFTMK